MEALTGKPFLDVGEESPSWDSGEDAEEQELSWTEEAASNLFNAIERMNDGDGENVTVSVLTRRVAREMVMHIQKQVHKEVLGSLRPVMRVLEDTCTDMMEAEMAKKATEGGARRIETGAMGEDFTLMADVLTRRIPKEMSKLIAKEVARRLTTSLSGGGLHTHNFNMDGGGIANIPSVDSVEWTQEASEPGSMGFSSNSSDSAENRGADTPDTLMPSPDLEQEMLDTQDTVDGGGDAGVANSRSSSSAGTSEQERVFQKVDVDAVNHASYRKFKGVLVTGKGLKVIKHHHNGGKSNRILKYDPTANRLYWESSKFGEKKDSVIMTDVVSIQRHGGKLYLWHMKMTQHGKERHMVGFEPKRLSDAIVVEQALTHLMNMSNPDKDLSRFEELSTRGKPMPRP